MLLLAAAPAAGQVLFSDPPVQPAAPLANEPVFARLEGSTFSAPAVAVRRTGFLIELVHEAGSCFITCPFWHKTVDLGRLPAGTYTLRTVDVSDAADPWVADETTFTVAAQPCPGVCLLGGRFTVTAEWTTATGAAGSAQPRPMSDATGAFWFFSADNPELVVKVLDACAYDSRHWVFAAGLTDVGVVVHVLDNLTGAQRSYVSAPGRPFQPITDTDAFGCP